MIFIYKNKNSHFPHLIESILLVLDIYRKLCFSVLVQRQRPSKGAEYPEQVSHQSKDHYTECTFYLQKRLRWMLPICLETKRDRPNGNSTTRQNPTIYNSPIFIIQYQKQKFPSSSPSILCDAHGTPPGNKVDWRALVKD